MGKSPARRPADEAKPCLPVEPVDLVDDAVDVIAEHRSFTFDFVIMGKKFIGRAAQFDQRIDRKTPVLEGLDDVPLRLARKLRHFPPGIGEEAQRPAGGDLGIKLAQRARRCIARIGEDLLARLILLLIHPGEVLMGHIDFAPYLEHVRKV